MVYFIISMRKFLAGIMATIIMIGTLAPVTFGLGGVQQKAVEAQGIAGGSLGSTTSQCLKKYTVLATDQSFSFGNSIYLKVKPSNPKRVIVGVDFTEKATIAVSVCDTATGQYVKTLRYPADATEIDQLISNGEISITAKDPDLSYYVKKITPDNSINLEDKEFSTNPPNWNQQKTTNVEIDRDLTDGTYQVWFEKDYNFSVSDGKSAVAQFDLANGVISNNKIVQSTSSSSTGNVRGDTSLKITKFNITEKTPGSDSKIDVSVDISIQNNTKTGPVDPILLNSLKLKSENSTPKINASIVSGGTTIEYNKPYVFLFSPSETFTVGQVYEFYITTPGIKTTSGSDYKSDVASYTIGKTDSLQMSSFDQSQTGVNQQNEGSNPETDEDFNCAWTDVFCGLVKFFVWFTTFIPSMVASVVGLLSDFLLHKAIQPEMYGLNYESPGSIGKMIYDSWKIVRDFSNILFIFALFVAAFMLIADQTKIGKTNFEPKKVVVKVIVMALLVNFSLFFCRMIIQTADVFSHILYNQITVTDNSTGAIKTLLEKVGVKSVSFGLVNNANPQQLMITAGVNTKDKGSTTGYLATGIIVFFVYLIFIYIFVSMLFIWMGRIVGSWMAMILAPIAFVSFSIPFIEDNEYIGFKKWLENFVHLAFLVPIYLFFVYIALSVMSLGELSQDIGTVENGGYLASTIQITLKTLIPLLASTFVLMQGKTIAYKLSGVIGEMAGKLSGSVTSLALGAATGGTALMARQTLGRAGNALGTNKGLMNAEAQGGLKGWGAGMLRGAGKATGAATFDIRNNKMAMDKFGQITGKMGEKIDLGAKGLQKEGGFAKEGGIRKNIGEYRDNLAKQAEERKKKKADELSADLKAVQEKEQAKLQKEKDAAQKSLDSENTKIATEAGEQSVDKIVDQATLNLAGINQLIADIDQKIVANGFNQTDLDTAQTNKSAADTALSDIDEKIKKNEELLKNGTAQQMTDASNKKAQLDQEKQDALKKQQDADAELALQQTKQTQHNELVKEKMGAEKNATSNKETIASFSKYAGKGMTVSQMKDQIGVDKMKAETSIEGKELQEAKKEEQKNRDKIKELEKKRQEAKKEGDLVEMDRLQGEIDKEKDKTKDLQDKTKGADSKFKAAHGDFKELEKGLENLENDYMKAQKSRLKPYEDMIQNLAIDIKQQQVNDKQEQEKLMNSLATNYDNAATNRSGFMKGLSKTTSVFSAGRFGGSNFNNDQANTAAATYARTQRRR